MDLNTVITGKRQASRRRHEQFLDFVHFRHGQRTHRVARIRVVPGGGPDGLHVEHRAAQQCAAVIDLAKHEAIVLLDAFDQARQSGDETVVINAQRIRVGAGLLGDHHRLGHDHCNAATRALSVIGAVTMRRQAVGRAVVCPHRGHDDTVLQSKIPNASRLLKQHGRYPIDSRARTAVPAARHGRSFLVFELRVQS